MATGLEDELGDILQKARDGKSWSQQDLARTAKLSTGEIRRIENYEWIPPDDAIHRIAEALNLDGPALAAVARNTWHPQPPAHDDPDLDLICLNVFMGTYPVKCYLLRCKATDETAVIDTGANPEAIIQKARELGVKPDKILLTHAHPDHAWGLDQLVREFGCPTWIDDKEPRPAGLGEVHEVRDRQEIPVGRLQVQAVATPGHTPGGVSYKVNRIILSGDTIFAGSMGRANSSWKDLYRSITETLFSFPDDTALHPGHGPATTVGEEKRHNPFFCGKSV
ncbi:MAG: MBL fold metallo-hydrolase [Nitrospinaceae bacterium]|nr:MBL fold metallo-hydrolase [Nitrospinaceae bacterium]NIR55802.1 MBL fold metallo-hydrolase [Nitrospinaceae bacterium]NIS86255.1 MBL fold metallo-hydrolase [Nitrospinaceae bacterium]NIT83084.1 MBL fold metallo-hydrolase [Nitrospinaceae bacterium]NIU45294.1 MBL fold metallo-hydrolase [Nitrospinaceae bacterium]